jgi:ATP-dependent RNA helicase DDX55/SPB4
MSLSENRLDDIEEEEIREAVMVMIILIVCISVKNLQTQDRDYIEKGKNAFVSFIRSYKEHEVSLKSSTSSKKLKYIFQFEKLQMGDTANSFFLYRLPRIKEILGKKIEGFQDTPINFEEVKFGDKNQESQFLKKKEKSEQKRRIHSMLNNNIIR